MANVFPVGPTSQPRSRFGYANAALAGLIVCVVGLMIVPLPTWLLDILLATNLAAGVTILLVTLYVTDALKIAAFPTLLLITTLFRLALNVSSTRLILSQGNAGEVIRAFGDFVVHGNYVVGAVVFLILTIIQFIVIAKGSERVAEVGARFTLDAMPGKQMAIDAELRTGAIDSGQARHRRRELNRESQFYGAMDGAMKFVKGDVIASLLITIINILGGLAIGIGQEDMSAVAALKKYGLLTIGDGLVSQIPALVIATAAGVLVTRVASEEKGTSLGQELGSQLLGVPMALKVASFFVVGLALVPGLPAIPFLLIGGFLFFASRARQQQITALQIDESGVSVLPLPAGPTEAGAVAGAGLSASGARPLLPMVAPWSVGVSADLEPLLDDKRQGQGKSQGKRQELAYAGLRSAVRATRESLYRDLGVLLPAPDVHVESSLPARHVVLSVHELPAKVLVLPNHLEDRAAADTVASGLLDALRPRASEFIGISETQVLLDQLEQVAPATVRQVTPKPISVTLLSDVLRRLAEEEISVRDLKGILEALAQAPKNDRDPLSLAEFVRAQLRRPITHSLTGGAGELSVFLLDPGVEETIRSAISRTSAGAFLALSPAAGRDIVTATRRTLESAPPAGHQRAVILTQPDIRRFVRKLVETDLPTVRVVSYAELQPEISLSPRGTVSLRGVGM